MPSGALKNLRVTVLWPNDCYAGRGWKPAEVQKWVMAIGGTYLPKFEPGKTTHLILSKEQWERHDQIVEKALENRGDGKKRLEIVSTEWLEEVLDSGKKIRESAFRWQTKDPTSMHRARNGGLRPAPKGPGREMRELLDEESRRYMTEAQIQEADEEARKIQEAEEVRKMEAEKIRQQNIDAWRSLGTVERKRIRKIMLTDSHDIYTDTDGFKYDVLLTKADMTKNKNERRLITIYESEAKPYTYAVSVQYQASREAERVEIVAPVGATAAAARRQFRKAFKEFTKVDWEDRFTGFEKIGSQMHLDFAQRPFKYIPPKFGAKGDYPGSELAKQMHAQVVREGEEPESSREQTPASSVDEDQNGNSDDDEDAQYQENYEQTEENDEEVEQGVVSDEDDNDQNQDQRSDAPGGEVEEDDNGFAEVETQNDSVQATPEISMMDAVDGQTGGHIVYNNGMVIDHQGDVGYTQPQQAQQDYTYEDDLMSQYVNSDALLADDEGNDIFGVDDEPRDNNSQQLNSQFLGHGHAQPQEYVNVDTHPTQNYDSQAFPHTQEAQDAGRMLGMDAYGKRQEQSGNAVLGKRKAIHQDGSRKLQKVEY